MWVKNMIRTGPLVLLLSSLYVGACSPTVGGNGGGTPDLSPPTDMNAGYNADAYFYDDPPAKVCVVDGGTAPTLPGGTPDCPSDKNREGCPCPAAGMTASCWPGPRADRGLGICKDGMTTCQQQGEVTMAWGPCVGYVLPTPGATGAAACECFSSGQWQVDNLGPCILDGNGGMFSGAGGAISTVPGPVTDGGVASAVCPSNLTMAPAGSWSANRVTADCAGDFKLCYAIKAGDNTNPLPSDCTIVQVCTSAFYNQANMVQEFPPLPSWIATSASNINCTEQFNNTGGYGEMSVTGTSVTCDAVGPKVFNRVKYCASKCITNPGAAGCANCGQGAGGTF